LGISDGSLLGRKPALVALLFWFAIYIEPNK